jgi:hypothetical protein
MTDRRVVQIRHTAAERVAIAAGKPVEQPKPPLAARDLDSPRRYELALQNPGWWRGAEQTRLELAGRAGWAAPTLQRSLDMRLHRHDGAAVIDADRQAVPMLDPLAEDRLRQLRIANEYHHRAKELERQRG